MSPQKRPPGAGRGRPAGDRGRGRGRPPGEERGGPRSVQATKRELGGDLVAGRQAVRELLAAGSRPVHDLWMAEGSDESEILVEITDLATEARVPIREVSRARLEAAAATEAPQGVLAHAAPLKEHTLDELVSRSPRPGAPFLVALDGVTDPHNLGAVLRSAEVAGATGVVLPRHRSALVTPTVAKAAAGAIEHLPIAVVPGLPAGLARLAELGVWIVGLDEDAEAPLFGMQIATEPLALVLGAEGRGLGRLTAQRCELLVTIPRHGQIGSLNVSAAATLACFEVARHRGA
jgi:23S rRNA (guanosine2251-2'-O)-methyltransferase